MSLSKLQEIVKDREAWCPGVHAAPKSRHNWASEEQNAPLSSTCWFLWTTGEHEASKCCPAQSPSRSGSAVRFLEGVWALEPCTLRRASGRSRTSSRKPPDSLLDQRHSNKEAVPKGSGFVYEIGIRRGCVCSTSRFPGLADPVSLSPTWTWAIPAEHLRMCPGDLVLPWSFIAVCLP